MELRHLRHFAAVIELENLSKAAVLLSISQPALTRSIQMLEEIVGAALIERRPRGVVATPAGEAMYRHAKLILSEAKRAREEVAAIESGARVTLRLGIASMFAEWIIDRAVVEFSRSHPEAGVSVMEGYFEDLLPLLQEGRLDLVFCNLPGVAVPDGLYVEPMLQLRSIMIANAGHPLARTAEVSRAQLADARWVIVNQPHMKDYLDHFFAVQGLQLNRPVIQTNSLPLIRSLLARDKFVCMLPEVLVGRDLAEKKIVRLAVAGGEVLRQAGVIRRLASAVSVDDAFGMKSFVAILRRMGAEETLP